jgi:hypothetical protein
VADLIQKNLERKVREKGDFLGYLNDLSPPVPQE